MQERIQGSGTNQVISAGDSAALVWNRSRNLPLWNGDNKNISPFTAPPLALHLRGWRERSLACKLLLVFLGEWHLMEVRRMVAVYRTEGLFSKQPFPIPRTDHFVLSRLRLAKAEIAWSSVLENEWSWDRYLCLNPRGSIHDSQTRGKRKVLFKTLWFEHRIWSWTVRFEPHPVQLLLAGDFGLVYLISLCLTQCPIFKMGIVIAPNS